MTDKLESQGFKMVDISKGARNIYIFEKEDSGDNILLGVYKSSISGWKYSEIKKLDRAEKIGGIICNSYVFDDHLYTYFYTEQ